MTLHGPAFGPIDDPPIWEPESPPESPPEAPAPPPSLDFSEDQVAALDAVRTWLGPCGAPCAVAWVPTEERDEEGNRIAKRVSYGRLKTATTLLSLGGVAGSGKTTITATLARKWRESGIRVAFATFTGKASLVLTRAMDRFQVTPDFIGTIHRLCYQPEIDADGAIRGWRRAEVVPYDLIVIDEASMVPSDVLDDLLQYGVPILAVGDHGQLPPVGEEARLMASPDLRLDRIHRQALGNPIIAVSTAIREGMPTQEILHAIEKANDSRVRHIARANGGLEEALRFTVDSSRSMLICYTNATRAALNTAARKARRIPVDSPPKKGESVICLRNNYNFGSLLANGARGIVQEDAVVDARGHYLSMPVSFEDGRTIDVQALACQFGRPSFGRYDEVVKAGGPKLYSWDSAGVLMDFGYALTCHKAQGSQAERVVVVLEGSLGRMTPEERKRWMYTSCTRASEELLLVSM